MVDFLLVLVERFLLALNIEALGADIGRNRAFERGVTLSANFRENGVSRTQRLLASES